VQRVEGESGDTCKKERETSRWARSVGPGVFRSSIREQCEEREGHYGKKKTKEQRLGEENISMLTGMGGKKNSVCPES